MNTDYKVHQALLGLYINAKSRLDKKRAGANEWELEILNGIEEKMVDEITKMMNLKGKLIPFPRKVKKPPSG